MLAQQEVTTEEAAVEARVRAAAAAAGGGLELVWGGTLYHPQDLPFRPDCK